MTPLSKDGHHKEAIKEYFSAFLPEHPDIDVCLSAFPRLCLLLKVGERYKDEKAIYFPHNLDFRGRAYTLHPHLTHLGADICRGILEFAEGKPLGEHGLEWLFIQVTHQT